MACDTCRCDSAFKRIEIVAQGWDEDQKNRSKIILTTPDISGNLYLKGYYGDGQLFFFDLTGRLTRQVRVSSGKANINHLPRGLWLWVLEDTHFNKIDQGKFTW